MCGNGRHRRPCVAEQVGAAGDAFFGHEVDQQQRRGGDPGRAGAKRIGHRHLDRDRADAPQREGRQDRAHALPPSMQQQDVAHGPVGRRRDADGGAEIDHRRRSARQARAAGHARDRDASRPSCRRGRLSAKASRWVGEIRRQRDPMGAPDGDHLLHQVQQELPGERIARGSARACGAWMRWRPRGRPGTRISARSRARMSELISALMPPARQACRNALARGDARPSIFAEYKPLHGAGLGDDAGARNRRPDIGDAAHQGVRTNDRPQHVVLLHAVLKRDHRRSPA